MFLKVMMAVLMNTIVIGCFVWAIRNNFQPENQVRAVLFCTGFLGMLSLGWLLFPGPFQSDLWLKLMMGLLFGGFMAFTAPKRWQFIQKSREHRN